jgi:phosphoadenosine phosphosulfate reductase
VNSQVHTNAMKERVATLQQTAEGWGPQQVLKWAFETFGCQVAISSAFGPEGMVVIDIAARLRGADFRLFTLDTEFFFPETYNLMERIEQKYGVSIERVYPELSSEEQERIYGAALWGRDPDRCCNLRKVEPLRQKLGELAAWIASIRRDQTSTRVVAFKIQWDTKFGLVKINPIADWTKEQVWRYLRAHDVPYNPLHDRGYPSIGCTHCTRSIRSGEDERAGRWAGFAKNECGLHVIEIEDTPSPLC